MAMILNGVDQYAYVVTPSASSAQDTAVFGIVRTVTERDEYIVNYVGNGAGFKHNGIAKTNTNLVRGRYTGITESVIADSAGAYSNNFKRVLVTWDESASTLTTYVEGETPVSTVNVQSGINMGRFLVGCRYTSSGYVGADNFLTGSVAHFAGWRGTLPSAGDIAGLMDGTLRPDTTTVVPEYYRTLVGDTTTGISGLSLTLVNAPTVNNEDPYALAGPQITNIDGDNDVYPAQSAVITGTSFGATQGSGTVTLGGVTQTVTAWADTSITVTVTQAGLKYGSHDLIVTDDSAVASSALSTTLSPEATLTFIDVVNPVSDSTSLFFGASPAVATGDQVESPLLTDQGKVLTVAANGTFVVSDAGNTLQTFSIRVWDDTDSTWSSAAVATINDTVVATSGVSRNTAALTFFLAATGLTERAFNNAAIAYYKSVTSSTSNQFNTLLRAAQKAEGFVGLWPGDIGN